MSYKRSKKLKEEDTSIKSSLTEDLTQEVVDIQPEVESSPEPLKTITETDITKIVGYINQHTKLTDNDVWEYTYNVYKEVTGYELSKHQCFSCKKTTIMNRLRYHALEKYNVKI